LLGCGGKTLGIQDYGPHILVAGDVPHVECGHPANGLARAQAGEYWIGIPLKLRKLNRRTDRKAGWWRRSTSARPKRRVFIQCAGTV
jgi:hypothetical protein